MLSVKILQFYWL